MGSVTIKTWQDAEVALLTLSDLKRTIRAVNLELERQVEALRVAADRKTQRPFDEALELEAALEAFCRRQLPEEGRRSAELTHGRVWLRLTPPALRVMSRWSLPKVLAALRAKKLHVGIRVKEELDREVLARYDDDTLRCVGLVRKQSEEWGYELFDPAVKEPSA